MVQYLTRDFVGVDALVIAVAIADGVVQGIEVVSTAFGVVLAPRFALLSCVPNPPANGASTHAISIIVAAVALLVLLAAGVRKGSIAVHDIDVEPPKLRLDHVEVSFANAVFAILLHTHSIDRFAQIFQLFTEQFLCSIDLGTLTGGGGEIHSQNLCDADNFRNVTLCFISRMLSRDAQSSSVFAMELVELIDEEA